MWGRVTAFSLLFSCCMCFMVYTVLSHMHGHIRTCHTHNTVWPSSLRRTFTLWVWGTWWLQKCYVDVQSVLVLVGLGIAPLDPNSTFTLWGFGLTKKSIAVIRFGYHMFWVWKDEELANEELASFPHLDPHHSPTWTNQRKHQGMASSWFGYIPLEALPGMWRIPFSVCDCKEMGSWNGEFEK